MHPLDNTNEENDSIIERKIHQRCLHRIAGEWSLADVIQKELWDEGVKLVDDPDDFMATTWSPRRNKISKVVRWYSLDDLPQDGDNDENPRALHDFNEKAPSSSREIPFIVATVDSPSYRQRYQETHQYLQAWLRKDGSLPYFSLETCHLLNLQDHPECGTKGILMQGWRNVLLPWLLERYSGSDEGDDDQVPFVFVAEDDIRFPDSLSPQQLYRQCHQVFVAHPHLHLLSLGHAWSQQSDTKKKDTKNGRSSSSSSSSLLDFLRRKPTGLHATTLLAVRMPVGAEALMQGTCQRKLAHWDQFLLHSTKHNISVAVSDPPLAGWAEVDVSLTKPGSGYRRFGGGRFACLPPKAVGPNDEVRWIVRCTQEAEESANNKGW